MLSNALAKLHALEIAYSLPERADPSAVRGVPITEQFALLVD
jgi:hypothetical protein